MSQKDFRILPMLQTAAIITLVALAGYGVSQAGSPEISSATFFVGWYDVGQAALEGLIGVKKVEKGFRGFKEINTVYYDPAVITIEEMETALKKARTYRGTAE